MIRRPFFPPVLAVDLLLSVSAAPHSHLYPTVHHHPTVITTNNGAPNAPSHPPTARCIVFCPLVAYSSRLSLSLCTCALSASTLVHCLNLRLSLESLLWNAPSRVFSCTSHLFRSGITLSVHPSVEQSLYCTIALTYHSIILFLSFHVHLLGGGLCRTILIFQGPIWSRFPRSFQTFIRRSFWLLWLLVSYSNHYHYSSPCTMRFCRSLGLFFWMSLARVNSLIHWAF